MNHEETKIIPAIESRVFGRRDMFVYENALQKDNPFLADIAQEVHARSYKGEGFIHDEAIGPDGRIIQEIDKSRGPLVKYYVGRSSEGQPVSTLRMIDAASEGGVTCLPGFTLCKEVITDEGFAFLDEAEHSGRPVKEISSFGHIPEVSSLAGVEMLRTALHDSFGTDEVWYFAMVSQKLQALTHMFGPRAIRTIGQSVALDDARISGVSLTPAIVDTTSFFDDIKDAINEEDDEATRRRYIKYLRVFTEGIDPTRLSDEVRPLLEDSAPSFSVVRYGREKGLRVGQAPWQQPPLLYGKNPADMREAKRLMDEGEVRGIIDPNWNEELGAIEGAENGDSVWVHYPWDESLVHFPPVDAYRALRHMRDEPVVTAEERAGTAGAVSLHAGLSVGSHIVEHMAYAGIGGHYISADFDTVSVSNLNRIHAGMPQVGEMKADALAKTVSYLDPYVKQTLLREGVVAPLRETIPEKPDIIFDEVDNLAMKVLLRKYAKEHKIPLVMATDAGYKSIIDIERHDIEDIPIFNGKIDQKTIDAIENDELSPEERMKIVTRIVGLSNASFRLLKAASDPQIKGMPQLEVTASQGGALATIAARDILLGRKVASGRHIHDARRAMRLPGEESLVDGLKVAKKFIENHFDRRKE